MLFINLHAGGYGGYRCSMGCGFRGRHYEDVLAHEVTCAAEANARQMSRLTAQKGHGDPHLQAWSMICGVSEATVFGISRALKLNTALTTLDLANSNVGDTGASSLARALRKNRTLTWLGLSNNKVGDGGARALASALGADSGLVQLHLQHNVIDDDGAGSLALALTRNARLEWLSLDRNKSRRAQKAFVAALTKNITLIKLAYPRWHPGRHRIDRHLRLNAALRRPRARLAAMRIHRFWRDACYDPAYAHARERIMAVFCAPDSEQGRTGAPARVHAGHGLDSDESEHDSDDSGHDSDTGISTTSCDSTDDDYDAFQAYDW